MPLGQVFKGGLDMPMATCLDRWLCYWLTHSWQLWNIRELLAPKSEMKSTREVISNCYLMLVPLRRKRQPLFLYLLHLYLTSNAASSLAGRLGGNELWIAGCVQSPTPVCLNPDHVTLLFWECKTIRCLVLTEEILVEWKWLKDTNLQL